MKHGWVITVTFLLLGTALCAFGAPTNVEGNGDASSDSTLEARLVLLQQQLSDIQKTLSGNTGRVQEIPQSNSLEPSYGVANGYIVNGNSRPSRQLSWQPMRRMVSWQPMKKSVDFNREQVIRAIEEQLTEVLHAGEKLGVSAEDVLADLRQRNSPVFQ